MTRIMESPPPGGVVNPMERGTVFQSPAVMEKRSLNRNMRKNELMKITMENKGILKRLQERQSHYNVRSLEQQYNES